MSSLRNAHKTQRVHKERHQTEARKHLGPLEKKKDYIERAKDQNAKKAEIRLLQQKALNKNPDEFDFHMIRSQLKDGVHYENVKDEEISISNVNQDLMYIRHRRAMEKKKIEKLKATLHLLVGYDSSSSSAKSKKKHILFVDDPKEARNKDPAELLDTHPSLLNRPFNRLKKSQLSELPLRLPTTNVPKRRDIAYRELSQRIEREDNLRILQEKLEVRKRIMARKKNDDPIPTLVKKGSKSSAPIYKWPQERKK